MTVGTEFAQRIDLMSKVSMGLSSGVRGSENFRSAITGIEAVSRSLSRDELTRFFENPGTKVAKDSAKPFARLFKFLRDVVVYFPKQFLSPEQQKIQEALSRADEALPPDSIQQLFENPQETIEITRPEEINSLGVDEKLTYMLHELMAFTSKQTLVNLPQERHIAMLERYEELIDCISANDQIFHQQMYGELAYALITGDKFDGENIRDISNPEIFRTVLDKLVLNEPISEGLERECLKDNLVLFIQFSIMNPMTNQPNPKEKRDILIKNIIKSYNNLQKGES